MNSDEFTKHAVASALSQARDMMKARIEALQRQYCMPNDLLIDIIGLALDMYSEGSRVTQQLNKDLVTIAFDEARK